MKKFGILAIITLSTLTGCIYKMPNEDTICTLPTTNNPSITREPAPSLMPGKG